MFDLIKSIRGHLQWFSVIKTALFYKFLRRQLIIYLFFLSRHTYTTNKKMSETLMLNENAKKLSLLVDGFNMEFAQLQAGKKAAGNRARKLLLEVKNLAHLIRKDIIVYVKGLPKLKRAPPSGFKKSTVAPIEAVEEQKVVDIEDVKEPEPIQEAPSTAKPKRAPRKVVVKKVILNPSPEQVAASTAKKA